MPIVDCVLQSSPALIALAVLIVYPQSVLLQIIAGAATIWFAYRVLNGVCDDVDGATTNNANANAGSPPSCSGPCGQGCTCGA